MKLVWRSIILLSLVSLAYAQMPAINAGGIINSGSYSTGGVAPGSVVSIFGTNLATQNATADSIPLPASLGDVKSLTFNGTAAALYFVSPSQINAQVPWDVLPSGGSGTADVIVTNAAGSSAPASVQIVPAMPGIFTATANGLGQAFATNSSDYEVAAGTLSIPGLSAHPVQIGGDLVIWCTGLGAVEGTVPNGANTPNQTLNTQLQPVVLIGGVQAKLIYSVLSPQYVSEYQVAVQVASGTPTGTAVPIQIQMNGVTSTSSATIAVAEEQPSSPVSTACTATSTGCVGIDLASIDPFSTGGFSGYADPTIRQDPLTGTLWMAYSWTHVISSAGASGTYVVDIHMADSTDGGKTWNYAGPLYTSEQVTNPVTGEINYTAHEVMNLLPQVVNGVTYWYGVHNIYYVPIGGAGPDAEPYTKRWEIAMAPGTATGGPMGLASATPQFLGENANTYPQDFTQATNLSSLSSEVGGCEVYYEPSLIISNNNLYLFLGCQPPDADPASEFYAVFKTSNPQNNPGNWQWTYVPEGATKFANQSDATSVGRYFPKGTSYITQMDIMPSKQPGVLLAVASAAYVSGQNKISFGCFAAELANVDPPKFVYDSQGQVQVDAIVTSPDSENGGPGSCSYSADSATGLLLVHKQTSNAPQNGGFFTYLMQSMLFP